jgi:hypothetical protein
MTQARGNPYMLARLGDDAYQAGFNGQAARLFSEGAETALAQGNIRSHVRNLRWTGNALMWAGHHQEACEQLLKAIAFDEDADADIEDVYGAMSDLCLMTARRGSYAALQRMLAETRMFLDRRARGHWAHRLDLTQAIAHLKRGEFADAYRMANRAWQQVRMAHDGPRYHNNSYLNHIFHAALGLRDAAAMDAALEQMQRQGEDRIQTCRVRQHLCQAIRLAFDGITETNSEQIQFNVEEALGGMAISDSVGDEISHALRLMGMLGRWEESHQQICRLSATQRLGTELVRLDLVVCRLAARTGWPVPFYSARMAEAIPPTPLVGMEENEREPVLKLLEAAEPFATAEDSRLNCTVHCEGVAMRRRWLLDDQAYNRAAQALNEGKAARP